MSRTVVILTACLLLSCGKKSEKPDEVIDVAHTPAPPDLSESKCDGNRVPPTQYLQETAFVPNGPNARQEASVAAVAQLRDRICQGYRCGELDQYITIWNTEQDTLAVCAMAVIKGTDVETFKDGPRRAFDADLRARAQEIVTHVNTSSDEPRIAFDNITDVGVDGGPRSKWLVDRMTTALSQSGALISAIPPDWSGLNLPKGTDAVLRANITPVHGREAMLEVTWKVQLTGGMKAVQAISFPELIGPAINPLTNLTELAGINPNIAIRLTGEQDGGGLCSGQRTEMILETSRDLYVRVINLFGDGSRGVVIFDQKTPVKANSTQPIGMFKASAYGGIPAERFLVFGSETLEGLGPLAEVSGVNCRLPEALATQYSSNRGFPPGAGRFTTSRSYRILSGPECSDHTPETLPAGWFEAQPECF